MSGCGVCPHISKPVFLPSFTHQHLKSLQRCLYTNPPSSSLIALFQIRLKRCSRDMKWVWKNHQKRHLKSSTPHQASYDCSWDSSPWSPSPPLGEPSSSATRGFVFWIHDIRLRRFCDWNLRDKYCISRKYKDDFFELPQESFEPSRFI